MRRVTGVLVITCLVAACSDAPLAPNATAPSFTISDGSRGGNPHFFFLPPLLGPTEYGGTFDPTLEPKVRISTAGGPDIVLDALVKEGSDAYSVNWSPDDQLTYPRLFRITISAYGYRLGYADLNVAADMGTLRNVNTDYVVPISANRTVPIRFRVEEGAVDLDWFGTNAPRTALFSIDLVQGPRVIGLLNPSEPRIYGNPGAMAVDEQGRVFVWNSRNISPNDKGLLLEVDRCTGRAVPVAPAAPDQGGLQSLAFSTDGTLFGFGGVLFEVDVESGLRTYLGPLQDDVGAAVSISGADTDPVSGVMYGLAFQLDAATRLVVIDPRNRTMSTIGSLPPELKFSHALAFDFEGNLWGSAATGSPDFAQMVYRLDPADATVLEVVNLRKFGSAWNPSGMDFGPACGG